MLYHYFIIIVGLISSFILFFKFPILAKGVKGKLTHQISIIIPARNEEKNLPLLLEDLKQQTMHIYEIICVDDNSNDATYEIASSFGVKLISIKDKPNNWTGKAWACQKGAKAASGNILLFLDADVRLSPHAILNLIHAYDENNCVISVQPYHQTKRYYEQFSFFFNLIQIAANSTSIALKTQSIGLYGPVILIDQNTYAAIDGHFAAQNSIVDDIALGEKLREKGQKFKLFMGGKDISFRMYSNNFKSLFQGWIKNFSTGAIKNQFPVLLLVTLWIASCITTVAIMIISVSSHYHTIGLVTVCLYICWVFEFYRISYKVGEFKISTPILFPIYLVFFIVIFFISLYKKKFQMDVVWKDRKIKLD